MKIISNTNCGNSPKNQYIEELMIGFLEGTSLLNKSDDKFCFEIAGDNESCNKKELKITDIIKDEILEAHIFDPISHGKKGAIDLELITKNRKYSLGIFIEFKTVKADFVSKLKIFVK